MFRHQVCPNEDRQKLAQRLSITKSSDSASESMVPILDIPDHALRSDLIPEPTPTPPYDGPTFLDRIPFAIKHLIFTLKLEMEKYELSEKLNFEYQRQLEWLIVEDRNRGCINDHEIADGLYRYDIEQKIDEKYGQASFHSNTQQKCASSRPLDWTYLSG